MPCNCSKPSSEKSVPLCVICDTKLFGRSDKRFCNIICKNKYHAELRKNNKSISSETIKISHNNYQILAALFGESCSKYKINKVVLQRKGFDFHSFTGMEVNKFGFKLKIFEFSWYHTKQNNIVVYRNQTDTSISPFVFKRIQRFGPAETKINEGNSIN
jgi:hypothetical protein